MNPGTPPQYPTAPAPTYPTHRPISGGGIASVAAAAVGGIFALLASSGSILSGATGQSLTAGVLGIAALVVGIVALITARRKGASPTLAIVGIIIGLVVVVVGFAEYAYYEHQIAQLSNLCIFDTGC